MSMTNAIKAIYHSSGGDLSASSTIIVKIAVYFDKKTRDTAFESQVLANNVFDHLTDEYNDKFDACSREPDDVPNFGSRLSSKGTRYSAVSKKWLPQPDLPYAETYGRFNEVEVNNGR